MPSELARDVDQQVRQARDAFPRTGDGRPAGHPSNLSAGGYLLSGFLHCECGGATLDAAKLRAALGAAVADVQVLLAKSTPQARQALRKVLVEGRLAAQPLRDGRRG